MDDETGVSPRLSPPPLMFLCWMRELSVCGKVSAFLKSVQEELR